MPRQLRYPFLLALIGLLAGNLNTSYAQDANEATEAAMKAAVTKAAPWVVKIDTIGGQGIIRGGPGGGRGPQQPIRRGTGPTTGVIVDKDGYIISSSFNFANKPSEIFVTIPGKERERATIVATDTSRMLTLLKVESKDLPMPEIFPKKDLQIGQWSLALGRALDPDISEMPSLSIGIVSALGRIWGKAIQTDAKISPVNYGGPLVAIDGRAMGVLIPASPQGEGDTAGIEWYDSGIGFAIPMEEILAVVPKLKEGQDLRRGLLGVTLQNPSEQYLKSVVVATVSPESAAAKAGIEAGDTIKAINDTPVPNLARLKHVMEPKYEGDTVSVTIERDGKEQVIPNVILTGSLTAQSRPFFGILPMRDDPEPGLGVRYVFPDSPAAGKIEAGDRIMKIAPANIPSLAAFTGRNAFIILVNRLAPGADIKVEVKKKDGKTETIEMTLGELGNQMPDKLPLPSTVGKALDAPKPPVGAIPKKKGPMPKEPKKEEPKEEAKEPEEEEIKTGLVKQTNDVLGRESWLYIPKNYDKNVSHGVILWLHAPGRGGKDADDMVAIWRDFCEDHHYIILAPQSNNPEGWVASESETLMQDVNEILERFTVDRARVIAHGMGSGGQMAYYLAFANRELIRGVAVSGAVLGTEPKDPVASQPLAFFIVVGDKDPLVREVSEAKPALEEKKYPVVFRQLKEFGKEYLDQNTLIELQRWMDSLDRI